MALPAVLRHVRGLVAEKLSDRQLLQHFAAGRDEVAFEALLRRHAGMVLGVARRVLADAHAAEDVLQATFLQLATRAATIRKPESLAAWLHGVAQRLAERERVQAYRRNARERGREVPPQPDASLEMAWRALDEELNRLSETLRAPLVLCYLEGRTQDEAARQLGWSKGTLRRRLESGRQRLHDRLVRRGVTLSAGLMATALTQQSASAALSPVLMRSLLQAVVTSATCPAATASGSASVLLLPRLLKLTVGLSLTLGIVAAGAGYVSTWSPPSESADGKANDPPKPSGEQQFRVDLYGDPLPAGALLRLGTVRLRHRQHILGVAFSPDGKTLASAGWDEAIRLWDTATGKAVRELSAARLQGTFAVAFSPDGGKLASIGEAGTVRLWNLKTAKLLSEVKVDEGQLYGVTFSPDGRSFATAGTIVRVWDAATGAALLNFRPEGDRRIDHHAVAFSPDGKVLASGCGTGIRLWSLGSDAAPVVIPKAHGEQVVSLAFAGDGKTLVSGGYQDVDISKEAGRPRVSSVGTVRVWDAATGKRLRELKADDQPLGGGSIAVSPGDKLVASTYRDRIRLWDLGTGKPVRDLMDYPCPSGSYTQGLAFSPDGKLLAAAVGDHAVRLWDVATGKPHLEYHASPTDSTRAVGYSPDGRLVATGNADGTVRLWDVVTGKEVRQLSFSQLAWGGVVALAFSPDGRAVAAGGSDYDSVNSRVIGLLKLWRLQTGEEIRAQRVDGRVSAIAFGPDGKSLAVASGWREDEMEKIGPLRAKNNVIHLWDLGAGKQRAELTGHEGLPGWLAFAPDGKALASVGKDGRAILWDVVAGEKRSQFAVGGPRWPYSAAFSPDGKTVVTSDIFGDTLIVRELPSGRELYTIRVEGSSGSVLALSPDGRVLASGSMGRSNTDAEYAYSIHLWEMATGREIAKFQPGGANAVSLAFAPDGKRLVSGLANATAMIWELIPDGTGRELTGEELEKLWANLAGDDAAKAYNAAGTLNAAPAQAVPFLRRHLQPVTADDQRIAQLIADLDREEFAVREAARKGLQDLGDLAEPALRMALAGNPSLEACKRIEALLPAPWVPRSTEVLRQIRAVHVLEQIGTAEAKALLERLATGAAGARQTRDAKAALERLAQGK